MTDVIKSIVRVYEHCGVVWADVWNHIGNDVCPQCGKAAKTAAHIKASDLLLFLEGPLTLKPGNEGNDYLLKSTHGSVWIEIGNIVAYVRRVNDRDEAPTGVAVDLIPTVCAHETMDCCNADFDQAEEHECIRCGEYNGGGGGFDGLCGRCADKAREENP